MILGNHRFQYRPCSDDDLITCGEIFLLPLDQGNQNRLGFFLNLPHPATITSQVRSTANAFHLPISNLPRKLYKPSFIPIVIDGSYLGDDATAFSGGHVFMAPTRENMLFCEVRRTAKYAPRNRSCPCDHVAFTRANTPK